VAALVKLPVFLLGGFLLITGRWRAAAAFAATVAALLGLSVLLYGPDVHRAWLGEAIGPHAGTALTALNNQSLAAQLARLWGGEPVHSYRPSPLPVTLSAARWAIAGAVLLGWMAARRRLAERSAVGLDFAMAVAVMPLVSPIFWIHYFLLSLPALLVLSRHAAAPGAWSLRGALVVSYLLAAWYPPADLAWYGRAPGFWAEVGNGRFLYSSVVLAAACFIAAMRRPAADLAAR
jgi:alpha-1,2-mannosyltransferase